MAHRNAVQRAFDTFGKTHFRVKTSGWWVRSANGVEQRLSLQKSQYARRYYLNFTLDVTAAVPEHLRHDASDLGQAFVIDGRVDDFFQDTAHGRLRELLDIDATDMESEHREHALLGLLEANLAAALDDLSSLDGIANYQRSGNLEGFLVTRSTRRVLNALDA